MTQTEAFYAVSAAIALVGMVLMGLAVLAEKVWPPVGMWMSWLGVGCFLLGLIMVWLGPSEGGA